MSVYEGLRGGVASRRDGAWGPRFHLARNSKVLLLSMPIERRQVLKEIEQMETLKGKWMLPSLSDF